MHIVIIGNGIAGITAARYIRKLSDHQITVISAETEYFFSRTALMYIYMGHMRYEDTKPYEDWFWEKNRIDLLQAYVSEIFPEKKAIMLADGASISFDKLIIATGSKSNKFGWPGQDLKGVQGLYSYQDLELMQNYSGTTEKAVIVGGGLIGIEMAEMLLSRNIPVALLSREKNYWDNVLPFEEAEMISRHVRDHHIDLRLETELTEIIGDESGRVKEVLTNKGEAIACNFVGLTPGVHPNIDVAKNSGITCNRGVLVDEYLQTNYPDIYALGDCIELKSPPSGRKSIEPVWYTGKIQGKTVAHSICGQPTKYNPGIWYNSAKFLDIEYQVYGQVPITKEPNINSIFWQSQKLNKSIRIVYDESNSNRVIGFNLMGIRFRHNICDQWISEKRDLSFVVEHIRAAAFDPEFSKTYEKDICSLYNNRFSSNQVALQSLKKLKRTIFQ